MPGAENVDDLTALVDGPVHVPPHPLDLHVGLAGEPPVPNDVPARAGRIDQLRREPLHQPEHGDMVDLDSALRKELFHVSVGHINWPHAKSAEGPKSRTNKKSDNRKSDGREERSHLAAARTHKDDAGLDHKHHFYWVGGDLCEATLDVNGNILLTLITPDKYEMRTNRDVTRREYFTFQTTCPNTAKPLTHRVGLFHADGPSRDLVHNFGEVARVYGPSNPNFPYLYGGRNDAESRHTNLKARIKYLPTDVLGQSLRILTAMVTSNSVSYQWHLKHLGAPNQIDGVA